MSADIDGLEKDGRRHLKRLIVCAVLSFWVLVGHLGKTRGGFGVDFWAMSKGGFQTIGKTKKEKKEI